LNAVTRKRFTFTLVFLGVVFLDRFTKQLVLKLLPYGDTIRVGGGDLLWIQHISNAGMAFGIEFFPSWFLAAVKTAAVIILGIYLIVCARGGLGPGIALAMIMGGAMGNLMDRLHYGEVIDFISVDCPDFIMRRFFTFNVADSSVFCGVWILILMSLFARVQPKRTESTESPIENPSPEELDRE